MPTDAGVPPHRVRPLSSMRARLTLWHTGVLAILLALAGGAAYVFLGRALAERSDRVLLDAVYGFRAELLAEREDAASDAQAAHDVMGELRFRDFAYVIYTPAGAVVAASVPPPRTTPGRRRAAARSRAIGAHAGQREHGRPGARHGR